MPLDGFDGPAHVSIKNPTAPYEGFARDYRQPVVNSTIHDTVDELSKVSWPTRNETSSSTIIVVVTSIVAALMLFLFDSVWSAVTDLVYKE